MNNKFSKFKSGFTLVELLVVLAIIVIMTGIFLGTQNNKNKASKDVESAGRQIAAMLRMAQNNALTGKMELDDSNNLAKVAYTGIRLINNPDNTLTANQYYNVGAGDRNSSVYTIKNVKIENVGTTCGYSDFAINYSPPFGRTYACEFGNDATDKYKFLFTSTRDASVQFTVCAYKSGRVDEIKGSVSCTSL